MFKIHFGLPDKPDDPVPQVIDSMEGTVMLGVALITPEGECNIGLTYSVENTTYVRNIKLRLKQKVNTFDNNQKKKKYK